VARICRHNIKKTPSKTVKIIQIFGTRKTHQIGHQITSDEVKTANLKMMADEIDNNNLRASANTQYKADFKKKRNRKKEKPSMLTTKTKNRRTAH
jgi:hypothetical protein